MICDFFLLRLFFGGMVDLQIEYDEIMEVVEDYPNSPFPCPFCSDILYTGELFGHFQDEHLLELKMGVLFFKF